MKAPFPAVCGRFILNGVWSTGEFFLLAKGFLFGLFQPPFYPRLVIEQVYRTGVRSLSLVTMAALGAGMIIALQLGVGLESGGLALFARFFSRSLLHDLGPVLVSVLIATWVAARIALEVRGIPMSGRCTPTAVKKIVVPRVLGVLIALPLLVVIANVAGVIGGTVVGVFEVGLEPGVYLKSLVSHLDFFDCLSGFLKTLFFALIIALIGCHSGLKTERGLKKGSASIAAAQAAGLSSFAIFVSDYFLTKGFWALEQLVKV